MRQRLSFCVPTLALLMLLPQAAGGQITTPPCGNVTVPSELVNPPELRTPATEYATATELSTTFHVQVQPFCIPTTDNKNGTWSTTEMRLRTYVWPDPVTNKMRYGLPGPTLRVRKANESGKGGQGLAVLLSNELTSTDNSTCNSSCPADTKCQCDKSSVDALIGACVAKKTQQCCCVINCLQESPNCFHGDDTTNLHFHGSHASPQEPQDYVLLELKPSPAPANAAHEHGGHGPYSKVVYGQYQYRVEPFGWKQPEGTHWYHPHKHGSVGMQVANGMAGALIVDGPFDDWLKKFYDDEKLIVIQQIAPEQNLYDPNANPPQILVNGQITPRITVTPGAVQRWRFVNATMSSGTLLKITFPAGLEFRQVAMDGIRFSPINYECQPLIGFDPANPVTFPCNPNPTGNPTLKIAPGNRADFLVRMPLMETKKKTQGLRVERTLIDIRSDEEGQRNVLRKRDEAMAPGPAEPALFTVVVDDGIAGNDNVRKKRAAGAKNFPETLPRMPDYLENITKDETVGNDVEVKFQQSLANLDRPWPYATSPVAQFRLNGVLFDPDCANITTTLNKAAEWNVTNETLLPHPFHIHTNPFQLVSFNGVPVQPQGKHKPEPIWMDTLSLPNAVVTPPKAPKDLTTPVAIAGAPVTIRQRYEDFTGEYVLHCHFLGHEDRGMMFAVQTVCPQDPNAYGKANEPKPECKGELLKAVPACKKK